jgi:hypothetical protein
MYFSSHPTIQYGNDKVIDIFHRLALIKPKLDNGVMLELYDIKDSESPEILAYNKYGSTELHWVILLINNIVNVSNDWPMNVREFNKYVQEKYTEPDSTHHYEDSDGDVVSITTEYPVTNYTYEERINNEKNRIKLLKPEYLESFVEEFKALL